jgi:hypothetical protein
MTTPAPHAALRVGLWVDGASATRHERALIDWAASSQDVTLFVLSHGGAGGSAPSAALSALSAIEGAKLRRNARYRNHFSRFQLDSSEAASAEAVRALNLDLLVHLGTCLPPRDAIDASRFGAMAFGWALAGRDAPIGFREVFEQRETTAFGVLMFDHVNPLGRTVFEGRVPTRHYYLLNRAALLDKANHYLRSVLLEFARSGRRSAADAVTSFAANAPPPLPPSILEVLAYGWRSMRSTLAKKVDALRQREVHWQVSFSKTSWRDTAMSKGLLIDNPAGHYLADPFVVRRDGRDYCFVEDFDCGTQRGGISVYELEASGARRIGSVLDEPFHMSFPFLFEYEGALFMCPETSEHRDIRVYRCMEFPLKWQLEKVLKTDVRAADTMLFERNGKWWMLTNLDPADTGEICSELYVFSADSPLSTEWKAHPRNPVVFDAGYARNGGLLRDGDAVFRVSQRQGFDRYGQGSQINEIVALDDSHYEERTVLRIDPVFRPGLLGTHHLHSQHGVTVFDFARMTA